MKNPSGKLVLKFIINQIATRLSIMIVLLLVLTAKLVSAQDIHLGVGLNAITLDKIYLSDEKVNPSLGFMYSRKDSRLFYELNFNYLSKENFSIPVLVRLNTKKKFSLVPGVGLNFSHLDNTFDVGLGLALGLTGSHRNFKFHLTSSFFQGVLKNEIIQNHPGGMTKNQEQNRIFHLNFILYYKLFEGFTQVKP